MGGREKGSDAAQRGEVLRNRKVSAFFLLLLLTQESFEFLNKSLYLHTQNLSGFLSPSYFFKMSQSVSMETVSPESKPPCFVRTAVKIVSSIRVLLTIH